MNISASIEGSSRELGSPAPVTRRKVFYVSGFDPLGPRRYRELHRSEGKRQAAIIGYQIELEAIPRTSNEPYRWITRLSDKGHETEAEFEFLAWDDIVRHSIRPSLLYVYSLMVRTFWVYLSSGAIRAMLRLRSGPLVAGLVPAAVMIFYLVFALLGGIAAGFIASSGIGTPIWAAASVGLTSAIGIMLGTRLLEEQMMVYFMVNDLGYTAVRGGGYPSAIDQRLSQFGRAIAEAATDPSYDEVLVVGHSSGAQLAVTAVARALEYAPESKLSLLTLGQSIAMLSFLTKANVLRRDLASVADSVRVFWLDVTAMGDGACFALTDPVATCRSRGRIGSSPLVVSAAFSKTMADGEMRRYRWRFMRLHFQYLCAFERPDDYDYFQVTGGSKTLLERYGQRHPSPSMIAEPVAPVCHPD